MASTTWIDRLNEVSDEVSEAEDVVYKFTPEFLADLNLEELAIVSELMNQIEQSARSVSRAAERAGEAVATAREGVEERLLEERFPRAVGMIRELIADKAKEKSGTKPKKPSAKRQRTGE